MPQWLQDLWYSDQEACETYIQVNLGQLRWQAEEAIRAKAAAGAQQDAITRAKEAQAAAEAAAGAVVERAAQRSRSRSPAPRLQPHVSALLHTAREPLRGRGQPPRVKRERESPAASAAGSRVSRTPLVVQPAQVQRGALAVSEAAEEVEARGRNRSRSRCVFDWCGRGNQLCACCEDWVRGHSSRARSQASAKAAALPNGAAGSIQEHYRRVAAAAAESAAAAEDAALIAELSWELSGAVAAADAAAAEPRAQPQPHRYC